MKRRISAVLAALLILITSVLPVWADGPGGNPEGTPLRIIFTGDIHDFFITSTQDVKGRVREHGGAARMKWIIDQYRTENTIVADTGDFSMGTLLAHNFETEGSELRILGAMGYDVVTLGNHEFDFGAKALSNMLTAAENSGDRIPAIIQSNMDFSGNLTEDQQLIKDHFDKQTIAKTGIVKVGNSGLNIGIIGLSGIDSVECSPLSGQNWIDYREAAKNAVDILKDSTDIIVCLSHSGTDGNGTTGEDIDLAASVDGIDVILSGHTHTEYRKPVIKNDVIIGSSGSMGMFVGIMDLRIKDGKAQLESYKLVECDSRIPEDPAVAAYVDRFKQKVNREYLAGMNYTMDEVICYNPYRFDTVNEMYDANYEFPMGNLIADAYRYKAVQCGVNDIDLAIVALGTIRDNFTKGNVNVEDVFEVCSLGSGRDGSLGHNLVVGYITGKELKLLTELDSSLGSFNNHIKMSYSGIKYRYNTRRIILDRVTTVGLDHGELLELIEDDKMYKICCNMYAVNMLGMLNGMTKGLLSIAPKDEEGNVITDFNEHILKDRQGNDVKEWVALADYMHAFSIG
ncbi:MAG: 5'-nucleotidase C-terminal domain-containing protein, partial [Clostridia bacterium]|nr:5'-nucleotidase C-terminal domain-containing protein [Clostridia bacterium]